MKNKRLLVLILAIIVLVVVIVFVNWTSKNENFANPSNTESQNTLQNTPHNSVTISASATPEVKTISLNDFLANCGKSSDDFVAQINTYSDQSLDDKTWVEKLNSRIDSVEIDCTNLAISDSQQYPSQVLYLRALASQKFPESITLFREGMKIKDKTVILAAISKFRDATNLLIGTSYYASSLSGVTPQSAEATKSTEEQTAEEAMNQYVIACSSATNDLDSIMGQYNDKSLTDTNWIQSINSNLDAFDKACGVYNVTNPPLNLQAVDYILKIGAQKCAETSLTLRDSVKTENPLEFVLGTSQFSDAKFLLAGAVAYGK